MSGLRASLGKVGALGQEAIARVDTFGSSLVRDLD